MPDRQPNRRDARCCSTCTWALDHDDMEGGAWCSYGVSRDPKDWPKWADEEEDILFNKVDLCDYVSHTEVCDAYEASLSRGG